MGVFKSYNLTEADKASRKWISNNLTEADKANRKWISNVRQNKKRCKSNE